ncbi:bifunctional riboflavin kinase/FAD synthetase [Leucobacter sp. GX24907]
MRVLSDCSDFAREDAEGSSHRRQRGTAIAIGKFDGVHLGHRALLDCLMETADRRDLESVVFTFANNPLSHLRPDACPQPLMSRRQRLAAIEAAGVSTCVMVRFDEALASIPAEEYISRVLVGELNAEHLIVGSDFRFGRGGAGDVALLRERAAEHGYEVSVVDSVVDPELGRISSTRVREAIQRGDVEAAGRMLGREVSVIGDVVHGDARGRDLGFPTANLGGEIEGLVPADGVYAGRAIVGGVEHVAAISVGTNPTFTPDGQSRVEAYLLDFDGDIYGVRIDVRFVARLRGMEAFTGIDPLIARMQLDVEETRKLFSH